MERLQRVLANRGVASRRAAEEMIRAGRVMVDGVVVTELGTKVDPETAEIRVDRKLLRPQALRYLVINKPSGYITTMSDERGRWTVMQLIHVQERVYPVGRLDRDTEGLLLLTNDGEVANRVMHPRYGLEKEYHVRTTRMPHPRQLEQLRSGIRLDDRLVVPSEVRIFRENRGSVDLTVSVHEGIFHIVRRMMEAVGIEVDRLRRWRVGPLTVQGLEVGEWRDLKPGEVLSLYQALHLDQAAIQERIEAGARRPVMTAQAPLAPLWRSTNPAVRIKEEAREQREEAASGREAFPARPAIDGFRRDRSSDRSRRDVGDSPAPTHGTGPVVADRRGQSGSRDAMQPRPGSGTAARPGARSLPIRSDWRPRTTPEAGDAEDAETRKDRPRREASDWGITKAVERPGGRRGRVRPERATKSSERPKSTNKEHRRGTERPARPGRRSDAEGRAPAWRGRGPGRGADEVTGANRAFPKRSTPDTGGRARRDNPMEKIRRSAARRAEDEARTARRDDKPKREERTDRRERPTRSSGPRRPFDGRPGRRTGKPRPPARGGDRRAGGGGQDDGR